MKITHLTNCSFCGTPHTSPHLASMITSANAAICDLCVTMCVEIVTMQKSEKQAMHSALTKARNALIEYRKSDPDADLSPTWPLMDEIEKALVSPDVVDGD